MMSDQAMWDEVSESISMGNYEPSEWEDDFLNDIESKVDDLTPAQREKLVEIHGKACG